MEKMRINKFLAGLGIASRREIDRMIEEKKIKVNGEIAEAGLKVDSNDIFEINGRKFNSTGGLHQKVYFLLNKPKFVISSAKDDRGRITVVDIIKSSERIFPIGRLDYETEGAIILTNDGELFNRVIHPRTEVYKQYLVEAQGFIEDESIQELKNGVELEDGITLPADIKLISREKHKSTLRISIREGRNRQIRRMMSKTGHEVISLFREKIGKINVEGLETGKFRQLTKEELSYLFSLGDK